MVPQKDDEKRERQPTSAELIVELQERAKELNCLYEIEELLLRDEEPLSERLGELVQILPGGWQYPHICRARVTYDGQEYATDDFEPTEWVLTAPIEVQGRCVGQLSIYYLEPRPQADVGPFLAEEVRLVNTIAERLGRHFLFLRLRDMRRDLAAAGPSGKQGAEWRAPIALLRQTDEALYLRIARKLLNHLCSLGVPEAQALLAGLVGGKDTALAEVMGEQNVPLARCRADYGPLMDDRLFELASAYHSDPEIMEMIQRWIRQDKAAFFSHVLENPRASLNEIADALRRFSQTISTTDLPLATRRSFRVGLCRRFLTEQLEFNKVAKDFIRIKDFVALLDRIILPPSSYGRLGGKAAGLLLAQQVLEGTRSPERPVGEIRVPRTWYIPSNGLLDFVVYNDLEDVIEQKWKEVDEIRRDYPNIVALFKASSFPPEMARSISAVLDDAKEAPLIVRSSSLLEDRLGTAFSGKYKSLFVANQGTKAERLEALLDAIAEVYASIFSPDPIEYRRERGLLEFQEEMGILIQEVVGQRIGKYYFPAFAGVAFSNNEFRWSPRIRREDGLVRLVPGLGTRAVDRVPDDYPVLVAPGQPSLRVNVDTEEIVRYSPAKLDVINLETRTLETVRLRDLLAEVGTDYPHFDKLFSVYRDAMLQKPLRLLVDPTRDDLVATFDGLLRETGFLGQMANILAILQEKLGTAVDVEFAHDGRHFHLLQCRPQSYADDVAPAPIPKDIPVGDILFTAHRFVSNGAVPSVTHIVYVDPEQYAKAASEEELREVARAVGALNKVLPKRRFILMGPGRWGSRDITLGVPVTYADINNTAVLIEIARRKGDYVPDLSFGTHFFQDLVEARIRYLPLYPDEDNVIFNARFLRGAPNLLGDLAPEYAHLAHLVRVIDIAAATGGQRLRVLMNADLNEAVAVFSPDEQEPAAEAERRQPARPTAAQSSEFWRWREEMAERIAATIDAERFGVVAMYVFGSTKNATAGPGSDIDLLIHFRGTEDQRRDLLHWLEGWSIALAEVNYLRTGYRSPGLLDVHLVTDLDIEQRTSYAAKINAISDAARELPLTRTQRQPPQREAVILAKE